MDGWDLRAFARRWPVVLVAAIGAEAVGQAVAASVVDALGVADAGYPERLIMLVIGALAGGFALSCGFGARWLAYPELIVTAAGVWVSFYVGPILWDVGDPALAGLLGPEWTSFRTGNLPAHLPFWMAASVLVMTPAQWFVWRRVALRRVHESWERLVRSMREATAADRGAALAVRLEAARLRLASTGQTGRFVAALASWVRLWLASPAGPNGEQFARARTAILNAATDLFGSPTSD